MPWDVDRLTAAARLQGPRAVAGLQAMQPLLTQAADRDEATRLQLVNDFFNRRIVFRDDTAVWGQVDHWASPMELLGKGEGDCEDFAIAKYFSLLSTGLPVAKLRLVYVRAQLGGPGGAVQAHMVLAYYPTPNAEPLILDNLIGEVRPASRRPDLTPVFSFNGEGAVARHRCAERRRPGRAPLALARGAGQGARRRIPAVKPSGCIIDYKERTCR